MDLQQQQLQQLSDWLTKTEERIRKMEIEPMAGDMEGYKAQIEQHKVREHFIDWHKVNKWFDWASQSKNITRQSDRTAVFTVLPIRQFLSNITFKYVATINGPPIKLDGACAVIALYWAVNGLCWSRGCRMTWRQSR